MLNRLQKVKRFTPLGKVFKSLRKPLFLLDNECTQYMGNGYFLVFSDRKFRIENMDRVEFGVEGEYALGYCFFKNCKDAHSYFNLDDGEYPFEGEVLNSQDISVFENITTQFTFEQAARVLRPSASRFYYQEGKTKYIVGGEFELKNTYIQYKSYEMFFFGESGSTPMGGFQMIYV